MKIIQKLRNIFDISKIKRMFIFWKELPKTIDNQGDSLQDLGKYIDEIENELGRMDNLERKLQEVEAFKNYIKKIDKVENELERMDVLEDKLEEVETFKNHIKKVEGELERIDIIEGRLEEIADFESCFKRIDKIENDLKRISEVEPKISSINNVLGNIMDKRDWLVYLNRELSCQPTIWGDSSRLHISSLSAVYSCFFNVNSGEITIGDYTFAGSNVSILAGNHDMYLGGLLRRDSEIKKGCDIVIGKGVWLASGCTILGPCTIGDNAVVAAGAVVLPGTDIPPCSVYGGIPAKMLKKIEIAEGVNNSHILDALMREKGVLFVEGWTEKNIYSNGKKDILGHILVRNNAILYTNREKLKFFYHKNVSENLNISITINDITENISLESESNDGIFLCNFQNIKKEVIKITINCLDNAVNELFIAPL